MAFSLSVGTREIGGISDAVQSGWGACCQRLPLWIPNLSLACHREQKLLMASWTWGGCLTLLFLVMVLSERS